MTPTKAAPPPPASNVELPQDALDALARDVAIALACWWRQQHGQTQAQQPSAGQPAPLTLNQP